MVVMTMMDVMPSMISAAVRCREHSPRRHYHNQYYCQFLVHVSLTFLRFCGYIYVRHGCRFFLTEKFYFFTLSYFTQFSRINLTEREKI